MSGKPIDRHNSDTVRYDKFRGESIQEILMEIRQKYGTNVYIIDKKEIKSGGIFGTDFLSKKIYEVQVMIPEDDAPYRTRSFYSQLTNPPKLKNMVRTEFEQKADETDWKGITDKTNSDANFTNHQLTSNKEKSSSKDQLKSSLSEKVSEKKTLTSELDLSDVEALIHSLEKISKEQSRNPSKISEPLVSKSTSESSNESIKESIKKTKENQISEGDDLKENQTIEFKMEKPTQEEIDALLSESPLDSSRQRESESHFGWEKQMESTTELIESLEDQEALFLKVREKLLRSEFSLEFTQKVFQVLKSKLPTIKERSPKEFFRFVIKEMTNFVYYEPEIEYVPEKTKVIFLVGPNGSGKTTSLAKLCAKFKLEKGYRISIISLDDYRVAATEQLKMYSDILEVPFYSPLSVSEFCEYVERDGSHFVFVDTSGLSFKDNERLRNIKKYIDKIETREVHLVLSVTMRNEVLTKFIEFFNALNFDKIILTGLDEMNFSGFFVELADNLKKPYSYFMNGQNVPEDIMEIEKEELIEKILQ